MPYFSLQPPQNSKKDGRLTLMFMLTTARSHLTYVKAQEESILCSACAYDCVVDVLTTVILMLVLTVVVKTRLKVTTIATLRGK